MNSFDYPQLSDLAADLLAARYLLPGESVDDMFWRVARHVASAERKFDPIREKEIADRFFRMMRGLLFLPNSPTLMNAGTPLGQLSACFVVPVEDSLESIFEAAKQAALIQKTGGGVGYDFSSIRPSDDMVHSTQKGASGPLPFIKAFDAVTAAVNQGGRRRGANMAVLRVDHPDILEFIAAKRQDGVLSNFNLSVAITDDFMRALRTKQDFPLRNPRTGKVSSTLSAEKLFDAIVEAAWASGEPGLLFIDRINRANPTPDLGSIRATNPCGEQPLLPWESCNLGSINLARMINRAGRIDWRQLEGVVRLLVRFLDNVIEVNRFPLPVIEWVTLGNRKIGLGVMGFADLLIGQGLPYDGPAAIELADQVMKFIKREARIASADLGQKRGSFPNFRRSMLTNHWSSMRNATVTSIAPTGSISLIAGCSQSIEPIFSLLHTRKMIGGRQSLVVHQALRQGVPNATGVSSQIHYRLKAGFPRLGDGTRTLSTGILRTAHEIEGSAQVRILAAFQRHVDNAVSKTVNLPSRAKRKEVTAIFLSAYRTGCKGITVYRDSCRRRQILNKVPHRAQTGPDLESNETLVCSNCG